jgi:type IV secretion system protein VirB4
MSGAAVFKVDQITKDWKEAGSFPAQINLYGFWDEHCFLTKSGDLGSVLKIGGVDYESLDHAGRDYAVKRLEAAFRSLDENTRLYQILFKRNRPTIPHTEYDNPLVRASVEQRAAFLESKSDRLYSIEIYWVVMVDGSYAKTGLLHALAQLPKHPRSSLRDLHTLLVDDSKAAAVAELGSALTALGMEGKNFGEFTLSVVIYDEDRVKVEHAVAEFQKLFTQHDGLLYEERYNLLNAFFATVPGNKQFNLRKQWALNSNYADLSFLFTVDAGSQWNPHLEREYVAVLESTHGTPYYFNLHAGDVGHAVMLGATGSGKSFSMSFTIQSVQKYDPLTFIFDLGGSYESLTRVFGGTYLNVGLKSPGFTINPFSLEPTPENMNFLYLFMRVLIEAGGRYELTPDDEKALFAAIERAYKLPAEIRTLTNFASILGPLGERLHRWTQAGQFGHLFDNAEDTLTFSRFQTFNFDGWSDYPDILEPLLFYVLQRASSEIEKPANTATFKVFVIDEAWIFLKNKTIRDWIIRAEKTWRKKNAAMILATQSVVELAASDMLHIVNESCPTKIFLANPNIDRKLYAEIFQLNDTQLELLESLVPKRELLLMQPRVTKKLVLEVDALTYWIATNNARDNLRKQDYFARFGPEQGLIRLAHDYPNPLNNTR